MKAVYYNVILRSDKSEAKPFRKWVTNDVLPSIRKNGYYATENTIEEWLDDPDSLIDVIKKLQKEKAMHKETEKQLAEKTLQLDENEKWYSVKRMEIINKRKRLFPYSWRKLKNKSIEMGYEIQKVFDANYEKVNAYHIDIWREVYGDCINQ